MPFHKIARALTENTQDVARKLSVHWSSNNSAASERRSNADGEHYIHYRPLLEKTPAAVQTVCAGILLACFTCEKAWVCAPDTSETLSRAWADFKSLYEKHRPWLGQSFTQ
ncbi:hypothetical protein WJ90_21870 [Burkholderia ubonensis]|uniref:hypothetical protein n=1 Tax=Burkholderia ubonensis TaxID=101571 RepID=UPI000752AECE|nr:hypothetical protein [Burkholderia ubonensis]KVP66096.1 hypothetical protein WJ90_21870 [Burkholderia ubonensis]KVR50194.1 hypothetical protein WK16_31725 [Burkholderia ubonensis]OJB15397.1 hypothetical protein BGV48_10730 [Burkholderia ubonensis]